LQRALAGEEWRGLGSAARMEGVRGGILLPVGHGRRPPPTKIWMEKRAGWAGTGLSTFLKEEGVSNGLGSHQICRFCSNIRILKHYHFFAESIKRKEKVKITTLN
jgi:hypothetical protein